MANEVAFKGDILIGDPCEMVKSGKDWQLCAWGERMEALGIETFLYADFQEDCPNVVDEQGNVLGSFCTDSSAVVVTTLQELLRYNKEFDQHIKYPKNWTVIKDFEGTVSVKNLNGEKVIEGKGSINFRTVA